MHKVTCCFIYDDGSECERAAAFVTAHKTQPCAGCYSCSQHLDALTADDEIAHSIEGAT